MKNVDGIEKPLIPEPEVDEEEETHTTKNRPFLNFMILIFMMAIVLGFFFWLSSLTLPK